MITTPVDPGSVQEGDFVHFKTASCSSVQYRKVLRAPAGKNYVSVELLGVPRWIHRTDILDAIRPIGPQVSDAVGPILDLPGFSGQPTGHT
jgi:hypothetical protein